jgi:hypothetical protein
MLLEINSDATNGRATKPKAATKASSNKAAPRVRSQLAGSKSPISADNREAQEEAAEVKHEEEGLDALLYAGRKLLQSDTDTANAQADAISSSVDTSEDPVDEPADSSEPKSNSDPTDMQDPPSTEAQDAEAEALDKAEADGAAESDHTSNESTDDAADHIEPDDEEEQEAEAQPAADIAPPPSDDDAAPWDKEADSAAEAAATQGDHAAQVEEQKAKEQTDAAAAAAEEQAANDKAAQDAAAAAALSDAPTPMPTDPPTEPPTEAVEEEPSQAPEPAAEPPAADEPVEEPEETVQTPEEPEEKSEEDAEEVPEEAEPSDEMVQDEEIVESEYEEELVCASCNKPHLLPDGVSMSEKLYLADGACVPCSFPHCNECVSDGQELHCINCVQPYLAIRSDDPLFAQSGLDKTQGQCQTCSDSCLECAGRPHWCTRCDTSSGLTMSARRLIQNNTVGTCVAVHPTCATSERPASSPNCDSGSSADDALTAEFSCTSCHEGEGLNLLPGAAHMGRCEPCDASCKSCFLANDPNSCTSCSSGSSVHIRDFGHAAGVCTDSDEDQCEGCVARSEAGCGGERPIFITRVLGETAEQDMGECQGYTKDCSIQCAPSYDTIEIPDRRVCTKHCLQKTAKVLAGENKIVVCKVSKTVSCTSQFQLGETSQQLSTELAHTALETEEVSEKCDQKKEATCAAALTFDMKHWVQDPRSIIEQATLHAQSSNKTFIESAPGCGSLGSLETVLNVCASTLLMF